MIITNRPKLLPYSVDANFKAEKTRRRLCQDKVCLFSNLDVRSPLELAMDFETAGPASRRFCCRIMIGSDIPATQRILSHESFVTTQPTGSARDPTRNNTCPYLFNDAFVILTAQRTATFSARTIIAVSSVSLL